MSKTILCARPVFALLVAGGAFLTAGCQNQLVFSTATKFGVDISQQANQTPTVSFGYDRVEVAIVPVPENKADRHANSTNDAYAVFGAFSLAFDNSIVSSNAGLVLRQVLATGNAARIAAKDTNFSNSLTNLLAR